MSRTAIGDRLFTLALFVFASGRVAHTQSPAVFDVVSIKLNNSGQEWSTFGSSPGGRLTVINSTVRELVRLVYQVQDFQLDGGPGWIQSERYDILAKADRDLPPMSAPVPGTAPSPLFMMIRSLLADRFKLVVHVETRPAPLYHLVLAREGRLGPQLSASNLDCGAYRAARRAAAAAAPAPALGAPPPPPPGPNERVTCGMNSNIPGFVTASAMPLEMLAVTLSRLLNRPVVDRTALPGTYDFTLEFRPERTAVTSGDREPATAMLDRPSIFTAVQEQLGLKLDATQGPVEFVVIDHVERPTGN